MTLTNLELVEALRSMAVTQVLVQQTETLLLAANRLETLHRERLELDKRLANQRAEIARVEAKLKYSPITNSL